MISPAASGPPSTNLRRGPTWLDRLRSSRGFIPTPAADAAHLPSPDPAKTTIHSPVDARNEDRLTESNEGDDSVSDILCHLFAMGAGIGETSNCSTNRRKNRRKQLNPKFWDGIGSSNAASGDDLRRRSNNSDKEKEKDGVMVVYVGSSGDSSLNQQRRKMLDSKIGRELGEEEEGGEEELDLKRFSRSEIMVMDSSVEGWKVEMSVFRKRKGKCVWKAMEKKSHESRALISCSKRKQKSAKADHSDDDQEEEEAESDSDSDEEPIRKVKKKRKAVRVSDSDDTAMPLSNQGQIRGGDKVDHIHKGVVRGEVSLKSFPCSNSHWKSKDGSSSVVLVKPNFPFDKIGTKKSEKISVSKAKS